MQLFSLMDSLFRDRNSLYEEALNGKRPKMLFFKLMLIFTLGAGIYGACMGSFRLFHPEFVFGDFEIQSPEKLPVRGRVAGINAENFTVYTERPLPLLTVGQIRFNLSRPSESVPIQSISQEKEWGKIVLPAGTELKESSVWSIPTLVAIKTPLLFLLTLLICAPALYVLNLALNIRLHFMPVMTLMALALAATGTMLAVFVPIAGLFSAVTENYHFMKIFHVSIFALAGIFGVRVLGEGLLKMAPEGSQSVRSLLMSWLLLYCIVGGQLAWTLKPFLGTPYLPATPPFRVEAGNIYVSVFKSMSDMGK